MVQLQSLERYFDWVSLWLVEEEAVPAAPLALSFEQLRVSPQLARSACRGS